MKSPPTVSVIDDDARALKALAHLLRISRFAVQTYESPQLFLRHHDPSRPGCIICDVSMPQIDGFTLYRMLKARGSRTPVIFLTGHPSTPRTVQAIKDGAADYVEKSGDTTLLLQAVHAAIRRDAARREMEAGVAHLTTRERAVIERIAAGALNKEIAGEFGVTERTIKFHRANLMRKMAATSTAALIHKAIKAGLIPETPPAAPSPEDPEEGKGRHSTQ